jgi:3-hydroxyacyl-[acyl-carrier-protein] dehydratase
MYYEIIDITKQSDSSLIAQVKLDGKDPLFKGHFPSQPVLPGACMIQILKAIMERNLNCKLDLKVGSNIKFLSIIDPTKHSVINYTIESEVMENKLLEVDCKIQTTDTIHMKFSGRYKIKQ